MLSSGNQKSIISNCYIAIFIFLSAAFTGCHTHSFIPQTQNVPLFTDKHQVSVDAALTYRSIEIQGATSPVDNLGVMVNIMARTEGSSAEAGVGYFYSPDKKFVAEVYGGYGRGVNRFKNEHETQNSIFGTVGYYNRDINVVANRLFIQPAVGIHFNDKINLAFSFKTCYWQFPQYYSKTEFWEKGDASGTYYFLKNKDSVNVSYGNQMTYEPAITFRAGGKYGKFMVQAGAFIYQDFRRDLYPYNGFPLFIRFGACVNIDVKDFYKKKQE